MVKHKARLKVLNRLRRKITVENLWMYVIASLLKGPTYAYDVKKRIRELFGFEPSTITLYAVIYSLKREGLIKVVSEQPKTYGVTDEGIEALEAALGLLEDNLNKLKSLVFSGSTEGSRSRSSSKRE